MPTEHCCWQPPPVGTPPRSKSTCRTRRQPDRKSTRLSFRSAKVLNQSGSLACSVDADGALLLATASRGDAAALEIDLPNSTAARSEEHTSVLPLCQGTESIRVARLQRRCRRSTVAGNRLPWGRRRARNRPAELDGSLLSWTHPRAR